MTTGTVQDFRGPARRRTGDPGLTGPVGRGVVGRQQVLAPVVGQVAQDRVDVVGAVLGVVVFDQEGRALDGVVVALVRLLAAQPGEGDAVEAGLLDRPPLV